MRQEAGAAHSGIPGKEPGGTRGVAKDAGSGAGTGPGMGPGSGVGPSKGCGSRVGAGVLGGLLVLFGLVLLGAGYERGPHSAADGVPGKITIDRCAKERGGSDTECSGTFLSDDGTQRHEVTDFEPGTDYDKGEKADALAHGPDSFDRGAPALYVDGARFAFVAVAMFGVALFTLASGVWPGSARAAGAGLRSARRWVAVTSLSMLGLGLAGCGICVFVNSVVLT
ncbi:MULTISPECIES: hypothetical protein [unclassified Streptomyces]|uniref:hypothetical protein n=1 Tax=unclassified Streptomyces TaxID=2593676 RepID=UPI002E13D318|nr:hypothetical protein OG533_11730 [Streptomyces sp. NBC_01186]WSS41293.1 hypothetical protein OG220_12275 [Streptomyces sp. NBC_01187]